MMSSRPERDSRDSQELDMVALLQQSERNHTMARADYLQITRSLLGDVRMTDERRRQIARLLDRLRLSQMVIIDR